jgi:putative endonuclease
LESLGYEIIERNYRCRGGEIDIVAREGGDLVFVEVKPRRSLDFGSGSEAVDARKQQKLILAAQTYLIERDLGEIDARFDIAEVYFIDGSPATIELTKGAFAAEG